MLRCDEKTHRCVIDKSVGDAYSPCYPNHTCNRNYVCDVEINTCAPPFRMGEEEGRCYANGTCNDKLVCKNGRCRYRVDSY